MRPDDLPEFQRLQHSWTGWLRDPQTQPMPADIEPRRLNIYRELFFNNVSGFVENAFPVLQSLLPAELWEKLTQHFFADHCCRTPYFHEIAHEFLEYFLALDWPELAAFPWARELAHFEWVELAADIAEQNPADHEARPDGDLLAELPCVSSLAWPLLYRWPVHHLAQASVVDQEPEGYTCLLVYRDTQDEVHLLEITPFTARLLETLQANQTLSGRQVLENLAAESGFADVRQFVVAGQQALKDMRRLGVILGAKNSASL